MHPSHSGWLLAFSLALPGCSPAASHEPAGASAGSSSVGSAAGASSGGAGAFANGGTGNGSGASSGFPSDPNLMPPIVVDPSDVISDAPLSADMPTFQTATHPQKPSAFFGGHAAPLPTNAFWENMALDPGEMLTNAFPYHVFAKSGGLELSRPDMLTVADRYCYETAPTQIILGANEAFSGHVASSWDPLSVTVRYTAGSGTMSTPVVYGMAYGTALYDGLTPKISSPGGIAGVNGMVSGSAQGTRFDLALKNGQHWILYASASVSATWNANQIAFSAPFKGAVRVALQTAQLTPAILDQYAGAIQTGAALRLSTHGETGVVEFAWQKQGTGDVLAIALPHQLEHLAKPNVVTEPFASVRGQLRGVAGDLWQLQYPLSPVLRAAPKPVDSTHHDAIVAALNADKGAQPDAGADSYTFGKQVGRAAELLLIAEALGETASADQLRKAIEAPLAQWFEGKNNDAFRYDQTYGGIVTSKGLTGSGADFGNGWYNDHHFHYGYFLFAAGAVAKGDPAFATQYKAQILALIRDIANPSAQDPYFTQYRMFDSFDGHSWASGLFPFQDGRNQESSSEAFNAWVGISLFGDATGDKNLLGLGRILRAVESTSVQRYYHIRKNSDIYPAPFRDRMVAGVLWSDKAEYTTFFSGGDPQIIGIQLLPMTIASEELIDGAWVQDAWPAMQAAGGGDDWRGLMTMAHAVIDPTAYDALAALNGVESGNSHTNMLYWGATRP
jgi:endo-1,3(4)-beta-glucanase